MDDEEEDIFDEMAKKHPHLLNKIYTPLTRVHLEPMSEKKTPASTLESPFTNIDRYAIEIGVRFSKIFNDERKIFPI